MYESLIDCDYDEIICVVLTGMGADGTAGIKNLNLKKQTYIIAQDQSTCTVYGMPKAIAMTGLVSEVVPLKDIAEQITKNVGVH
jgi:two-component system chemotaxis response regulator CheB